MVSIFFKDFVWFTKVQLTCSLFTIHAHAIATLEKEQLKKINLGIEKNLHVKMNFNLELVRSGQLVELLKEFKDIFAWTYKN